LLLKGGDASAVQTVGDLSRLDRARKVIEGEGVKMNRFSPSGICIWTVTGRDCSYIVDCVPPTPKKPYCTCDDFHYRVLSGRSEECYHLVAAKKAIEEEMYSVVELEDQQYPKFMKTLIRDIFTNIS
jgi:predicted nucleic acid-binding Zn finger protein